MQEKEEIVKAVNEYRVKYGLEGRDENLITIVHFINSEWLDLDRAIEQTSDGSKDFGIDGWFLDGETLHIYQSKVSESKAYVLGGLDGLLKAAAWLEGLFTTDEVEKRPDNRCLYNLFMTFAAEKANIRHVNFVLLSPFSENELEDTAEAERANEALLKSKLKDKVKISLRFEQYCLKPGLKKPRKKYPVPRIKDSTISLRADAHLDLAYIPLTSLIDLYRQRGDVLFEKNVRMSISYTKESKDRLVNPMEATFDAIVEGRLDPKIFPFYHVGVTICALRKHDDEYQKFSLESPNVINGAQTITIANNYLKRLEADKDEKKLARFSEIKVIAKIVTGTTDEELKEITNSNNRQNPIENWQLFCNDPIHIHIELALKHIGVFYERQRGKFQSVMKKAELAKDYFNTNNAYITVMDLGQIIAFAKSKLQWAAKPSEIFLNKTNHDAIFDNRIHEYTWDMVFMYNIFKALRRGLQVYLQKPVLSDDRSQLIFSKPIVRAHVYYIGLLYYYRHPSRESIRIDASQRLHRIANSTLVDDTLVTFQKYISKFKNKYLAESRQMEQEVSKKKLDVITKEILSELGISHINSLPFSQTAISWSE